MLDEPTSIPASDEAWRQKLTPEQYRILREKATEAPFSGEYVGYHGAGEFSCAGCGQQLFDAGNKFDSGTGWPSFDQAVPGSVELRQDTSHGMERIEVICSRCGSHLGHVFTDEPTPTGERYCINSACLRLRE